MESIVKPHTWSEMPEPARKIFEALLSPTGEQMVLEQNFFIEVNLPRMVLRHLTEEEMTNYRRPFADPGEGRRPMLTWPRQFPFDGVPADVTEIITVYGEWLSSSPIPKLFIQSEPGTMPPNSLEFCRAWPNQSQVTVPGLHYPQEDAPGELGLALVNWMQTLQ